MEAYDDDNFQEEFYETCKLWGINTQKQKTRYKEQYQDIDNTLNELDRDYDKYGVLYI